MHVRGGALHVPLAPQVRRSPLELAGALTPLTQPIAHVSPGSDAEQPPPGPSQPRVISTLRYLAREVGGTAVAEMLGFSHDRGVGVVIEACSARVECATRRIHNGAEAKPVARRRERAPVMEKDTRGQAVVDIEQTPGIVDPRTVSMPLTNLENWQRGTG